MGSLRTRLAPYLHRVAVKKAPTGHSAKNEGTPFPGEIVLGIKVWDTGFARIQGSEFKVFEQGFRIWGFNR